MARNINEEFGQKETAGDKIARSVAAFVGSWAFIGIFLAAIAVYVLLNSELFGLKSFDCFPYVFLNLLLACVAALQAPMIMMSQNNELKRDRLRAEQDFELTLRAEQEIQDVQEHLHRMELRLEALLGEMETLTRPESMGENPERKPRR